ncbi:hypothetical protein [Streptomyces sp. NPDC002187]|uniref:hypothetical protein n=1 Tax=Streptomyces sp. NPDC002187 TaxID=3364637 RepID=UPI0036A05263
MTSSWRPDRGVRRAVVALVTSAVAFLAAGLLIDAWWLIGIGVWALIAAIVIELVHRP